MKPTITYDDFTKLDLRVATILSVEEVEGADKLLKLTLDVGRPEEGGLGERVVAAGMKPWYSSEDLVGKTIVYLANLKPKMLRGVESQGMLVAASPVDDVSGTERAVLLLPEIEVKPGTTLR